MSKVSGDLTVNRQLSALGGRQANTYIVEGFIDFTTAEPAIAVGEIYINTVSGLGFVTTAQNFDIGKLYKAVVGGEWFEITPEEGWIVDDKSLDKQLRFDGTAWLDVIPAPVNSPTLTNGAGVIALNSANADALALVESSSAYTIDATDVVDGDRWLFLNYGWTLGALLTPANFNAATLRDGTGTDISAGFEMAGTAESALSWMVTVVEHGGSKNLEVMPFNNAAIPLLTDGDKGDVTISSGLANIAIKNSVITGSMMIPGNVSDVQLGTASVTTPKLADDSVTADKLAHGTANFLLGYNGLGAPTEYPRVQIVDNLVSISAIDGLSANMGRLLADQISAFGASDFTVNNIADRNALTGLAVAQQVFVKNAIADPEVTTGWAVYRVETVDGSGSGTAWITLYKAESILIGTFLGNGNYGGVTASGNGTVISINNDQIGLAQLAHGPAGGVLGFDPSGNPAVINNAAQSIPSNRIGEFVYRKSGATIPGMLPVNPGTVVNGKNLYPIWSALYPEFISGVDIVFPADVNGMFLRNVKTYPAWPEAYVEGVFQPHKTSGRDLSTNWTGSHQHRTTGTFTTSAAGGHGHTTGMTYTEAAGGRIVPSVLGGYNFDSDHASSLSGSTHGYIHVKNSDPQVNNDKLSHNHTVAVYPADAHAHSCSMSIWSTFQGEHSHQVQGNIETNPDSRSYQLYAIVDGYNEMANATQVPVEDAFVHEGSIVGAIHGITNTVLSGGRVWNDLKNKYAYIRFEFSATEGSSKYAFSPIEVRTDKITSNLFIRVSEGYNNTFTSQLGIGSLTAGQITAVLGDGSAGATYDSCDISIYGILGQKTLRRLDVGTTVTDDDTMLSVTDLDVPSGESIKAYVDANANGHPLIDDNTFATASFDNVASALSIKSYVDANASAGPTLINDNSFATATTANISSSSAIKAYVDSNAGGSTATGLTNQAGPVALTSANSGSQVGVASGSAITIDAANCAGGDRWFITNFGVAGGCMLTPTGFVGTAIRNGYDSPSFSSGFDLANPNTTTLGKSWMLSVNDFGGGNKVVELSQFATAQPTGYANLYLTATVNNITTVAISDQNLPGTWAVSPGNANFPATTMQTNVTSYPQIFLSGGKAYDINVVQTWNQDQSNAFSIWRLWDVTNSVEFGHNYYPQPSSAVNQVNTMMLRWTVPAALNGRWISFRVVGMTAGATIDVWGGQQYSSFSVREIPILT